MSKRVPRPYQNDCVAATLAKLRDYNSTVAVLPTGLGKTTVASTIIAGWEQGNTLFLAHTRELIHQAADRLAPELGYRPPLEMGVSGVETGTMYQGGMCVVGSVQTMYGDRRLEKYRHTPFGLIIIDECHHANAATYRKIIDFFRSINPFLKVLGITATPNRADGAALGVVFESVAYQMSIQDAIQGGWLVPIVQEYVTIGSINYDGIRTKANEFGEADFNREALSEVMQEQETIDAMALALIEKAGDRSTLMFMPGVRDSKMLAAALNAAKKGSAESVDGKTDALDRKRFVDDFRSGRLQFLVNCQVYTEGFDAPNCSCIGMGRPTKSLSLYMQMLGRGLRSLPGTVDGVPDEFDRRTAIFTSDKKDCLVLDFVGNSNHKLANSFEVLGGNYDTEVRQLAQEQTRTGRKPVSELMEESKALLDFEREMAQRDRLEGTVTFQSWNVDPFGDGATPGVQTPSKGRGGCSDGQIGLLVKLGVAYAEAASYTKGQAGAVITSMSATRCTTGQAKVLTKHGIDPTGIPVSRASRIIDAIASNGWTKPKELPQ